MANNTTPNTGVGGLLCAGVPTCEIANSVFWMNSNQDLYVFYDAAMMFDDIAHIALFLASDESHMITGASIPAAGGRSAY